MKPLELISPEAYLASEIESPVRREYVDGRVYALPGDTINHGRILGNCLFQFARRLRDSNYEAFASSTKIRILEKGEVTRFYYPDVAVFDEPAGSDHYHENPLVIFEVLSQLPRELDPDEIRGGYLTSASLESYQAYSTRRTDEGEKRLAYQSILSLRSYLLVEQSLPLIVHYRRTNSGFQRTIVSGKDSDLIIPCLSLVLPLRHIYRRVSFAAE